MHVGSRLTCSLDNNIYFGWGGGGGGRGLCVVKL